MAIFNYIISLSIRACVIIPLALLVRTLIAKYPKRYSYLMLLVVFLSLVVRINVNGQADTPLSWLQGTMQQQYNGMLDYYTGDINIYHDNTEEYYLALQQGIKPQFSEGARYVVTAADGITAPDTVENTVMPIVFFVWVAGIIAIMFFYIKNVVAVIGTLRFAVPYKDNIYYSEYIKAPFVFGIRRAKIYLPCTITKEQEEQVIAHEKVHIARLDHILKPLCLIITALHWFNPLVWVAFNLFTRDMEYSCDEAALKSLEAEDKKNYCDALLQFAVKEQPYKISAVMFGEGSCSQRIKNVLDAKHPGKLIAVLLAVVVMAVAVVSVTAEKAVFLAADGAEYFNLAQLEGEYSITVVRQDAEVAQITETTHDLENREYLLDASQHREIIEFIEGSQYAQYRDFNLYWLIPGVEKVTSVGTHDSLSYRIIFRDAQGSELMHIFTHGDDYIAYGENGWLEILDKDWGPRLEEFLKEEQLVGVYFGYHNRPENLTSEQPTYVNENRDPVTVFTHDIETEDNLPLTDTEFTIVYPTTENTRLSRGFVGQYPQHCGVDIAGAAGTEIYAAEEGVVTVSREETTGNGNHIIIAHANGYSTLYAHCDSLLVSEGDSVKQGQLIATMGCTGNSTGNHLHFEVVDSNGQSCDPYEFMK